jgi:hypothetical protein
MAVSRYVRYPRYSFQDFISRVGANVVSPEEEYYPVQGAYIEFGIILTCKKVLEDINRV